MRARQEVLLKLLDENKTAERSEWEARKEERA